MNSLLDFWTLEVIKSCLPTTKHLNYQVFYITQDMPNNENTNDQRYCHWTIKYEMLNWLPTNLAHRYQSIICLILWNYPQQKFKIVLLSNRKSNLSRHLSTSYAPQRELCTHCPPQRCSFNMEYNILYIIRASRNRKPWDP